MIRASFVAPPPADGSDPLAVAAHALLNAQDDVDVVENELHALRRIVADVLLATDPSTPCPAADRAYVAAAAYEGAKRALAGINAAHDSLEHVRATIEAGIAGACDVAPRAALS